ncbi:DNA/RNA helicase domain-containing protein [Nocardia yamanashiensis]|uniref:DNA/RNA helicase domain-containing protein n=1 Tax=Nocardia yamanashiensis TaxID=209247 RepID=UPI001F2836A6|nr:DNA/RNA helicase domain-containing protein [Nocardia yamanashiensis]
MRQLLEMARFNRLPVQLLKLATSEWEQAVGMGEVRSWRNSLSRFLDELDRAGFGDIEVLLEHKLPHSPKRVDAILCGVRPGTGAPSYVLVELKQWSKAELVARDLVKVPYYADLVLHPVAQIREYCRYLMDFTPDLERRPDVLRGIAYMHNASFAEVGSLLEFEQGDFGQLFLADDEPRLRDFLASVLNREASRESAYEAADQFLSFPNRPTKKLLDLAAEEIARRERFVLLDEQRVAYETVALAVNRAWKAYRGCGSGAPENHQQTVVVVVGGPGSGKSVIALSLMGHLARRGAKVNHATGSSAFTKTMQKVVGTEDSRSASLFKYFNSYSGSRADELEVLICDEAHRIRTVGSSAPTGQSGERRRRSQLEELIDVAMVPVLFLDDNQVVRPGEAGSLAAIRAGAEAVGCRVDVVHLSSQFRCGGSDLFEEWVDRLLGLSSEPSIAWSELSADVEDEFVVAAAATPRALEAWVHDRHDRTGGTARLSAGFCWKWSDKPTGSNADRRLASDVRIGDWSRPWNAPPGSHLTGVPDSYYWAFEEGGIGQVGCIYTAQGFEYDWAGVIFGDDLVRRGDRWLAQRERSQDSAVRKADDSTFAALIRNTYKVLVTRGMRGACIYSADAETQNFFERMVGVVR